MIRRRGRTLHCEETLVTKGRKTGKNDENDRMRRDWEKWRVSEGYNNLFGSSEEDIGVRLLEDAVEQEGKSMREESRGRKTSTNSIGRNRTV
jgi:hypothetical protein